MYTKSGVIGLSWSTKMKLISDGWAYLRMVLFYFPSDGEYKRAQPWHLEKPNKF